MADNWASVDVSGVDDFRRFMDDLTRGKLPKQVIGDLGREVRSQALPAAAAEAPVGDGRSGPAGRLRASGRVRRGQRGRGAQRHPVIRLVFGSPITVPYAGVIHWGSPTRNIAANQFVTRAIARTRPAIEQALDARLLRFLQLEVDRYNRT